MKYHRIRSLIISAMLLMASAGLCAQNWLETLRQQSMIDSIVLLSDEDPVPSLPYRSYMIYYHQPLVHANPSGEQFQLRALLTVNPMNDVSKAVNQMHIGGYGLEEEVLLNPNSDFGNGDVSSSDEIAHRYNANYIQPEYRYFSESAPDDCWSRMESMRSDEAADDFHALITALKTVFHGKWAISGTSKGGIAAAAQFTYHPEDADVFVPYVAPIFDSYCDTTMQQYWLQNGWSHEWRDLYLGFQQKMLYNLDEIYPACYKMIIRNEEDTQAKRDSSLHAYLTFVGGFGFDDRAYSSLESVQKNLNENASILAQVGFPDYTDTVCAYMAMTGKLSLKGFPEWLDTLRHYSDTPVPESNNPVKPYYYQAKAELGYYDIRFDLLVRPGDEAFAAQLNEQYRVLGSIIDFSLPSNHELQYSQAFYLHLTDALQHAAKPVIFIYGEDDPWTGRAIQEQFLNGTSTRRFILPNQNHGANFSTQTDPAQCLTITNALDAILGTPQGIETIGQSSITKNQKRIINGRLILFINNEQYDITGKKL